MSKNMITTRWTGFILRNLFFMAARMMVLVGLLSACAPDTNLELAPTLETPTLTQESIQPTPDRLNRPSTKIPERVPPTQGLSPVTGEVPIGLMDQIMADLEERIGVSADTFSVLQAQAVVWNDGSLGCPEPGQFYTQATVNGYQVIIEVNDKQYDYHASDSGYFILCENSLLPLVPQETPDA
jgi:hypothetical protein